MEVKKGARRTKSLLMGDEGVLVAREGYQSELEEVDLVEERKCFGRGRIEVDN